MNFKDSIDYVYDMLGNFFSTNKQNDNKQFSLERAKVETWYNTLYTRFVVRSGCLKKKITITSTGVATYTLDSSIYTINKAYYVDGTTRKMIRKMLEDNRILNEKESQVRYYDTSLWSAANVRQITFYGTPATSKTIELICVCKPTALSNESDTPIIPSGYEFAVVNGVIAMGQNYIGIVNENDKNTPLQMMQIFLSKLDDEAMACRREIEGTDADEYQMLTKDETFEDY